MPQLERSLAAGNAEQSLLRRRSVVFLRVFLVAAARRGFASGNLLRTTQANIGVKLSRIVLDTNHLLRVVMTIKRLLTPQRLLAACANMLCVAAAAPPNI